VKIEQLSASNFESLKRFSEEVWQRPTSDAYYTWRYLDAPGHTTLLATQGERCVGTVSAFCRKYQTEAGIVDGLEAFDWYTLPAMRGSGVGIRLMKSLLDLGKPMVALGGSEDTLDLLPRLGFKTVAAATEFFLPLSGAYILRNKSVPTVARRFVEPFLDVAASLRFKPGQTANGFSIEYHPLSGRDAGLAQATDGLTGFRTLPDAPFLDWLSKGVGTGSYIAITVAKGRQTLAWCLARLYRAEGLLHGAILEIRTVEADPNLAVTTLKAVGRRLAELGADDVRGFSTSDALCSAYAAAGFLASKEKLPAMIWSGKHTLALDRISLSCGPDGAFWPLQVEGQDRLKSAGRGLMGNTASLAKPLGNLLDNPLDNPLPLRVALLTDGTRLPAWLAGAISGLQEEGILIVSQIIPINTRAHKRHILGFERLYYRLHEFLETLKSRSGGHENAVDACLHFSQAGVGANSVASDTGRIEDIDLLVNCGVEHESRLFGRLGTLIYEFAGTSGNLGIFRALIHGDSGFSLSLKLFDGKNSVPLGHARPAFPDRPILRNALLATHRRAASLLTKTLRALARGNYSSTMDLAAATASVAPAIPRVGMLSALRYLGRRGVQSVRGRLIKLRPEQYWIGDDAFNWFLAYRTNADDFVCNTPRFRPDGFELFLPPIDRFYADPCAIRVNGVDHVFFEECQHPAFKGVISWMTIGADGRFTVPEVVLEEAHHLSYPFVFEAENAVYMIPESAAAKSVDLYRAVEFPRKWTKVATLLDNISAVDSTVIEHAGKWWMFASVGEEGSSKNDQLHIYHADSVRGPWSPHGDNPVKIDVSSARSAGRLFKRGDKLIRPSQDCSVVYGGALTLSEVVHLSMESYSEVAIERLSPDWLPFNVGFHTVSSTDRLEIVDGRMRSSRSERFPLAQRA